MTNNALCYLPDDNLKRWDFSLRSLSISVARSGVMVLTGSLLSLNTRRLLFVIGFFRGVLFGGIKKFFTRDLSCTFHSFLKNLFGICLERIYKVLHTGKNSVIDFYCFSFFFWSSAASFSFFSSSSRLIGCPAFFHCSQTVAGSLTRKGFSFSFFRSTPEFFDLIFISKFYIKEAILPIFVIQSYEKTPGFETKAHAEMISETSGKFGHIVSSTSLVFISEYKFTKCHVTHFLEIHGTQLTKIKFRSKNSSIKF
jgi:hypothetical protein